MTFNTRTLFITAITAGAIVSSGAAMAAQPPGLNPTKSDVPLYTPTDDQSGDTVRVSTGEPAGLNTTNSDVPVFTPTAGASQRAVRVTASRPAGLNTTNSDVPLFTPVATQDTHTRNVSHSHHDNSDSAGVVKAKRLRNASSDPS